MNPSGRSTQDMTAEADRIRARLLRTVEKLDQRRHDVTNLPLQLGKHGYEIAIAGGIGVLLLGIEQFLTHRRAPLAARRRRRWQVLAQLWNDPDRALRSKKRPFVLDALRSLGISLITSIATAPAHRAIAQLVAPTEAPGYFTDREDPSGTRKHRLAPPRSSV